MNSPTPGRTCPLSYQTQPEALSGPADLSADTVYIIGGLYGNRQALAAIEALAQAERAEGLPKPVLVFNGDFNWFNASPQGLADINDKVLRHWAIQGNVEAELANPAPSAGCGCAYPHWVADDVVERSNLIMQRLQAALAGNDTLRRALAALTRQLRVQVGECRVGVLHGDPESIAGWGLAVESMPDPGRGDERIEDWFRRSQVDLLACTHTCLPFAQDFCVQGESRVVINNGSAGMPNFGGSANGLITRISVHAGKAAPLYGTRVKSTYVDAILVEAVTRDFLAEFEAMWPSDSPAHQSYFQRLQHGPSYTLEKARRVTRHGSQVIK